MTKCEFVNCSKEALEYGFGTLCEEHLISAMLGGNQGTVEKILNYIRWKDKNGRNDA